MTNEAGSTRPHDGFPLLGGLASVIVWLEELVGLLSGPLLTLSLGIAIIDLLSGGRLLLTVPWLLYLWAGAMGVGADAQLISAWYKCRVAAREGRWLAVLGFILLGCALGYVGFLSASAFGFQQAFHLTETEALARLGIDEVAWTLQRAGLAVFLVALSGFNRFHPPAQSVEDEKATLLRQIELEPLRQRARELKAVGAVGVVQAVRHAALGRRQKRTISATTSTPTPKENAERPGLAVVKSPRERVYAVLSRTPGASKSVIAQRAGVSETTAGKYRREWLAERGLTHENDAA